MSEGEYVIGLDLGSTKVCAICGGRKDDGGIEIIGVGQAESNGLRKGVVVNIDATAKSIATAVEEMELMSGLQVNSVYAGIAGGHIKGMNSKGVVAISNPTKEIGKADVERVIDAAKAVAIPLDREVIHVITQEFKIDGQDGIKDPVGMSGVRLEADVHIVTGQVTSVKNIIQAVQRANYEVDDFVLAPLASAYATLTEDERELGVVLVDIGGGTTDIAVFVDGSIWHTEVLAIGGEHITRDLSMGLRTTKEAAETLKCEHGCALARLVPEEAMIEVPSVGGRQSRPLRKLDMVNIIQPRVEEIFMLINREIKRSGYEDLVAAGVVITGGSAALTGMQELGEEIHDLPVRIGNPRGVDGLVDVVNNPKYATAVGLVQYGFMQQDGGKEKSRNFSTGDNLFKTVFKRMSDWYDEFF
ncbi:MAG TPA: cell division protein FtsA [bacterium]|nr:cell division protein FtsA [bacterium]